MNKNTPKPTTTVEFLDAMKAKLYADGVIPRPSDNALSSALGITRQMISKYRNKGETFSDETALTAARLLDLPPAYVVACIHAEREKTEAVKDFWRDLARRMVAGFAALALVSSLAAMPSPADASQAREIHSTIHIMSNRLRRLIRRLRAALLKFLQTQAAPLVSTTTTIRG